MITMRATALTQIRDSFRSAEANVISGTKNAISWRIATIAKSEIASPAHVARETFGETDGWFEASGNDAARLFVSIGSSIEMPETSSLDSRKYETALRVCWQPGRLHYNISATGEAA
jgi:hypothetical protein